MRDLDRLRPAAGLPRSLVWLGVAMALSLVLPATAEPAGIGPGTMQQLSTADREAPADLGEIDAQLRLQRWDAALAVLRAKERSLAAKTGERGQWLARLAVAEAGLGQSDQALWHWAVANDLDTGLFTAEELRAFGEAGALLAGHPRRQPGKAPSGTAVEPPGPELRDAVRTAGEMPRLDRDVWSPRQWLRLEIVIDDQGRPRDPLVLAARSGAAAYRALEAVHDWRFSPATRRGTPVAVLHTIEVNPPGRRPIAKIIMLSAETEAIESLLRQGRWQEAEEQAKRRWYGLLDSTSPLGGPEAARAALGLTMALRALARAGQDARDPEWARCRWEAAQSLLPSLYDLDPSPYGAAGKTVAAWQQEIYNAPLPTYALWRAGEPAAGAVLKPESLVRTDPYYPGAAKKQHLEGKVILESVLDAKGEVRNPVLLQPLGADDQVAFAASALDAVCDWRFKPATLDGKPVRVYYTLTVNFAIRGH